MKISSAIAPRVLMSNRIVPGITFAVALLFANGAAWSQALPARGPAAPPPAADGPIVATLQGKVQGFVADDVAVFRGLPFAAPPVGELRWQAPQAPAKWSGVKAANAFGESCAQAEDCLYLNIYEPQNTKANAKLPVMVWIHGGAFIFGSGAQYNGTQFAKQGVIVVTVNYRLGRAGWFAHPALTREHPNGPLGNYGLMDQIAALQWVRDNIPKFGGDIKNVTIFGESAGAISVNYLMIAPQARGLFNKALSESGFGRLAAEPLHTANGSGSAEAGGVAFAEKVGISGTDAAAAKALRALTLEQLKSNVAAIGAAGQILPMADGKYITGSAEQGFAENKEAHVPYLLGGNSDEASLTRRGLDPAERLAAITENRDALFAAYDPGKTLDAAHLIAHVVTDSSISEPDRALARLHTEHGAATYIYHFSYLPESMRATAFGLPHGGEIQYVFNTPRPGASFDAQGKSISEAANKYWAQFGKNGNPDSAGGPEWPKFDLKNESLMEFGPEGSPMVEQHFHKARLDWVEKNLVK